MAQELLGDLVREGTNQAPSRLALIWRDQEISYLNLDGQIEEAAHGFMRLGVGRGDRIAFYMHNAPQFVIAFYALQRLGVIVVPINIHWKGRDLEYLLAESRVSGVVTVGPLFERVKEAKAGLSELKWIVAITAGGPQPEGSTAWEALLGEPLSEPVHNNLDAVDPALIAFTGGRTGPSRPALLSHFNLLANCQQMQDLLQVQFLGGYSQNQSPAGLAQHEIALLPLPLFNLFSLNIGLNLVYKIGGTAVLMEKFDPALALELIERHSCTLIFGSPATFTEIVNLPGFKEARLDSLRYVFSYGAPIASEIKEAWQTKMNKPIFNCYGVTEASPVLACEAGGAQLVEDSAGPALPMVQLYLLGSSGESLPADHAGEVLAKGPNLMLGYFNPQDPTYPLPARSDGWFATSDLALIDHHNNFHIIDRREDSLLLPNGELLVPRDIERVLCTHPGIWQVTALPHTTLEGRHRMVSFAILNEAGRHLTEPQLLHYAERRLPTTHAPERIFIYKGEDFPRLPNGAVWRRALRAQIQEYL